MGFAPHPAVMLFVLVKWALIAVIATIALALVFLGFLAGKAHAENSYTVLILVCSLSVTPDLKDCNRSNAIAVIEGRPENNAMMCGFHGQAQLASTELGRGLKADESLKVLCIRSKNSSVG